MKLIWDGDALVRSEKLAYGFYFYLERRIFIWNDVTSPSTIPAHCPNRAIREAVSDVGNENCVQNSSDESVSSRLGARLPNRRLAGVG